MMQKYLTRDLVLVAILGCVGFASGIGSFGIYDVACHLIQSLHEEEKIIMTSGTKGREWSGQCDYFTFIAPL